MVATKKGSLPWPSFRSSFHESRSWTDVGSLGLGSVENSWTKPRNTRRVDSTAVRHFFFAEVPRAGSRANFLVQRYQHREIEQKIYIYYISPNVYIARFSTRCSRETTRIGEE